MFRAFAIAMPSERPIMPITSARSRAEGELLDQLVDEHVVAAAPHAPAARGTKRKPPGSRGGHSGTARLPARWSVCPNSPAQPFTPSSTLPSSTIAPPMPVLPRTYMNDSSGRWSISVRTDSRMSFCTRTGTARECGDGLQLAHQGDVGPSPGWGRTSTLSPSGEMRPGTATKTPTSVALARLGADPGRSSGGAGLDRLPADVVRRDLKVLGAGAELAAGQVDAEAGDMLGGDLEADAEHGVLGGVQRHHRSAAALGDRGMLLHQTGA